MSLLEERKANALENIKQYLEESGKSQRQVAAELGINKDHLNRIIKGRYPMTSSVAILIEAYLEENQ